MHPKITIEIKNAGGGVYEVEVKNPPLRRQFRGRDALISYISSRFAMEPDEVDGCLKGIDDPGDVIVAGVPILPENISSL